MQTEESVVQSEQQPPAQPAAGEQPAPGAEAQNPGEGEPGATDDTAQAAETPEQQEAKKQSKFQRRLERQKTARVQAETENRILRERLAALEAGQQRPAPQADDTPKRDQFADYEEYVAALARHEATKVTTQTTRAQDEQRRQAEHAAKQRQTEEQIATSWVKREAEFQATTKDYEETVVPFVEEDLGRFGNDTRRLIAESEVGPQLVYHLAKHPDDADRIADLSPMRQLAEIGKLEDKMQRPARKTSSAPPPIDPPRGSAAGGKNPQNMTVPEYKAFMAKNGSRFVRP